MQGSIHKPQLPLQPLTAIASHDLAQTLYNRHVQTINQTLKQVSATWHEKLNDDIKPLAHLSTRALLGLLENSVNPLQIRYRYLANQPLTPAQKAILDANHEKLKLLKHQIHLGLRFRCTISAKCHLPRQVDDLEYYATKDKSSRAKLATLDDDSRLIIYDLLLAVGFDSKQLFHDIVAVVPKRSYPLPRKIKDSKQAMTACYAFTHNVVKILHLKPTPPDRWFRLSQKMLQAFQPFFSIFDAKMRYPLYFVLSLGAYYLLLQAISPLAVIFLSESLALLLNKVLFYTIGLLPLWSLASQYLYSTLSQIGLRWRSQKTEQIVEALFALEQAHQFMNHRLSQVIVDITHYDFALLHETITVHQCSLKQLRTMLQRYTWREKITCTHATKMQAQAICQEIDRSEVALSNITSLLIKHITARVKEELTLLQKSLHHRSALVPVFPADQYTKIKQFIREYGTADDLARYEAQANVTHLWLHKWHQFILQDSRASTITLQQPWGGYSLRQDLMHGWQILLKQLGPVNATSKSALAIHALLRGKQVLSLPELTQAINAVCKPADTAKILEQCQWILFKTLSARKPTTAALLSPTQKALLAAWYHAHAEPIAHASKLMKQMFSRQHATRIEQFSDEDLARCYELLDGADIYHYAHGMQRTSCSRQNLARQYFEVYQGQSSRAFRLLKFVPLKEKAMMLCKVARLRLTWLLDHLAPFDEIDIELFLQHKLSTKSQLFDFAQGIRKHSAFNKPWTAQMEQFLNNCRNYGLDSGKLLTEYQTSNHRIKTFLVKRPKPLKVPPACASKAKNKGQRHVYR